LISKLPYYLLKCVKSLFIWTHYFLRAGIVQSLYRLGHHGLDKRGIGFRIRVVTWDFFLHNVQIQPAIRWTPLRNKAARVWSEPDHSVLFQVEIMSSPLLPRQYVSIVSVPWCLIQPKDNFIFAFLLQITFIYGIFGRECNWERKRKARNLSCPLRYLLVAFTFVACDIVQYLSYLFIYSVGIYLCCGETDGNSYEI
jgi:hypothetical protein